MTNEYKENLLKYFTGSINQEEQENAPVFDELLTYSNGLMTYINNNITGTMEGDKLLIVQGKDGTGKDLDSFILVGTEEYNDRYYSFIILLDEELNPIQLIENYTSGVRIGQIYSIKVNQDGTFYFVEYNNANDTIRLILSNNILVKSQFQNEYFCKIRISYNLPENLQNIGADIEVFKNNTGSYYGFIEMTTQLLIVETLKIEVGSQNEWKEYIYNFIDQFGNTLVYNAGYCYWNEDNFSFECVCNQTTDEPSALIRFFLNSNDVISYNTINVSSYEYQETFSQYSVQIIAPNHEYIGLACTELLEQSTPTGNFKYYLFEINENSISKIYEYSSTYDTTIGDDYPTINLKYKNGIVFYFANYPINTKAQMDYGLIYNGNAFHNSISNLTPTRFYYFSETFAITNQYNLIKYIMPMENYAGLYVGCQIFNINNYNGTSYEQTKSVLPNSANLYDENNHIIFSRNLYNKMVYNNTCVSTLQIPNTMLNNKTISKNNLISYNNNIIVNDNTQISKNIYEVLDLNYYNIIKMENRNDLSDIKENVKGAIRLNDSANKTLDVTQSCANKVKILFQDQLDSSHTYEFTFLLSPSQITITNNIATYDFVIYCPPGYDFVSLDILSRDGNTNYLTIKDDFESGKYYRIQQEVAII